LDRFHLSFAEDAEADVLLTMDDKFEKACSKISLKTEVKNPLNFILEDTGNGRDN
jgi:hypothetical protein